jgi:5-oxoprolinase (ATP-hydrolysing)
MPPFSKNVEEEGVLLDNVKLVEDGRMLEGEMRALLGAAATRRAIPTRTSPTCARKIAANEKGVQELRGWWRTSGCDVVRAYMSTSRTTPRNACAA